MTVTTIDLQTLAGHYAEHGYVLVKGLLTRDEAAAYRRVAHDLLGRQDQGEDPTWGSAAALTAGAPTRLQHLHDAQFYAAAFSRLLVDERFTSVAAAVLGVPNVQLHHTKLFVKPPENGSPFPLHQDHPFFPHTHHRVGAAIFHLDDAPELKGCVRVVPGSHLQGPREHDPEDGHHLTDVPFEAATPLPAEAGDVLFFSYLTVHGSGVNVSDEARTTWLVQFRDPADPPAIQAHDWSLGQGMMLSGVDPTGRRQA
ncbi:phytanoyl-CoA dioxygenase family protein [Planotetraspora mira]|uniref:Protein involved in biosynthesis of mitomycin antibiotics/polyketide fumonisin n=1 Tax=Planotetraspora mira TaxID=58121 RepID=A0A8J3XB39_9ACTN|nr:phytanoyl-CoA dioxygenase family protein [Planotetraspora mira]GII33829.1 protein involved in biosynthesis of mitomycin antibiotics/polyketide fumonisin [Planotetraspora mira]